MRISESPCVGSSNQLATCRDFYWSMCIADKPKSCVCVEEAYFDSCTDGFLYLVQLVFTVYFIIIICIHFFTLSTTDVQ